jgi:hypothetical protein
VPGVSQGFLHQGDQRALCLQVLPHRTGNRYPPWFLKALLVFYICCYIGWLFSWRVLGLHLVLCHAAVLSSGDIVCRLHQVTVAHTLCRVSGTSPVILSTPLQGPRPLAEVTLTLFALIVSTIVREGPVVAETVSSV